MNSYSYVGWTPCVNGHLDFALAKVGIKGGFTNSDYKDDNVVEKNYSLDGLPDSHHRAIVLQSKVDWRDSSSESPDSGLFRVFVAAEVVETGNMDCRELIGSILIYHLDAEPQKKEDICALELHQQVHGISRENVHEKFPALIAMISSPAEISDINKDSFITSLSFKVRPNGLTYLRLNERTPQIDERSEFVAARQAFYYLKYSLHSHRHHLNEQDSLTTISSVDTAVGLRLLCQLKRELTGLSRAQKVDKKIHATSEASGIIAYAKSLVVSLAEDGLLEPDIAKREAKYFDNMRLSFMSLEKDIESRENILERHKAKAKVWLGFILVFLLSLSRFCLVPTEKVSVSGGTWYFITLVVTVTFAGMFLFYQGIVRYYRYTEDPDHYKKLYDLSGKTILFRSILIVIIALSLAAIFFLNGTV